MREIIDLQVFLNKTGLNHLTVARWLDISGSQLYKYFDGSSKPPRKRLKKINKICTFFQENQLIIPESYLPLPKDDNSPENETL